VGAALVALIVSPHAEAGTPTTELREFVTQALDILERPETTDDPATARKTVQRLASGLFDARGVAPIALGSHWRERTPTEREEFARVFGDLVEAAYLARLEGMLARTPTVRYHGESISGRRAIVHTSISTKTGGELPVDYSMEQGTSRWRVHDVVIDGVSLIDNYAAQIARTLKRSSYEELVGRMKARVPTTEQGDASAALPAEGARPSVPPPGLTTVRFETAQRQIGVAAARALDESIAWLERHPDAKVVVEGHADARGAADANRALAERRAEAVRDYLVARGADPDRISVVAYGADRPLCEERREACWAMNRRAVLRVTL